MNTLVGMIGLILILFFILSFVSGKRMETFQDMQLSAVPDICSTLNSSDCNKTQGCIYSPDVGLCVKKDEIEHFTASAMLTKDIVGSMSSFTSESDEPVPNGTY